MNSILSNYFRRKHVRKLLEYIKILKWYALITLRIIYFAEHNKNFSGNQYSDLSIFKSVYFN